MIDHLIAERYARALDAAVPEDGELDAILEALRTMAALYAGHRELRILIDNPSVSLDARKQILAEVIRTADLPEAAAKLIKIMLARGRISSLPSVATLFSTFVDARLHRATVAVTTAKALSAGQAEDLSSALSRRAAKSIRLEPKVDPEILGGVIVNLEGTVIDGSLRARLARAKRALLAEET